MFYILLHSAIYLFVGKEYILFVSCYIHEVYTSFALQITMNRLCCSLKIKQKLLNASQAFDIKNITNIPSTLMKKYTVFKKQIYGYSLKARNRK